MKKCFLIALCLAGINLFGSIQTLTTQDELNALTQKGSVVVDFYADWCGPCKKIAPIMDKLSDEFGSSITFAKVNSDDSSLGKELGVNGLPTVILFKAGKEASRFVGYKDEATIRNFLQN